MMKNSYIKDLNKIALPLIIQSISGQLIGAVDQMMVGRISSAAIGAIGTVSSLLYMLSGILGSTSVVLNIRGSKCIGKGDENGFIEEFISTAILNIILGVIVLVSILLFKNIILIYIYGFKGEMLQEAIKYINIMSGSVLVQLLLFNFAAIFRIKKNTKWILIFSTSSAIINIGLDYLLIFGNFGFPKLGTIGNAIGSMAALLFNLVAYVIICRKYIKIEYNIIRKYIAKIKQIRIESLPFMGQEILEGSIFVIAIDAIISRVGADYLSSYKILAQIISILLMPMYMYGSAILTLVSQSEGERNIEHLRKIPKVSLMLSMTIYLSLAFIVMLFRQNISMMFTDNPQIVFNVVKLMLFLLIAHLFNPVSTVFKYSLQAVDESKFVLFGTAIINGVTFIIMIVFIYAFKLSIYGIFISLFLNYFSLYLIYRRRYNNTIRRTF